MTYDTPTWTDDFATDDPTRWISEDTSAGWPPRTSSGKWLRCFYNGWPSNTGGQDPAARTLAGNHEAECYEQSALTVSNGLTITATNSSNNHFGLPWTSGVICQNLADAQLHGYFEIVSKSPKRNGFWPAFWLLPVTLNWTLEIDVYEMPSIASNPLQYHLGVTGQSENNGSGAGGWVNSADVSADFHKYGVLWDATNITFFCDDVQVQQIATPAGQTDPMYMIVNLAVGGAGSWPGVPDSTAPAVMSVQRVSAYALGSWGDKLIPSTPPASGAATVAPPVVVPPPVVTPPVVATPPATPPATTPVTIGADMSITLSEDMKAGTYTLTASAPATTPAASTVALAVNLSQDIDGTTNALCNVTLDGVAIATGLAVTAIHGRAVQPVALGSVDTSKPHTIVVTFLNDQWKQADLNLYVESYTLGGKTVPVSGGTMYSNGSFSVTVPAA